MQRVGRNNIFDLIKLIASYMVVFLHVPFSGVVGIIIGSLSRFAVPFFFMISGYFCYGNDSKKIVKKIKALLKLYIVTILIYQLYYLLTGMLVYGVNSIPGYFSDMVSMGSLLNFIVYNMPYQCGRLWLIGSLIYVYLLIILFDRCSIHQDKFIKLSFCTLILHLFLGEVLLLLGVDTSIMTVRNFVFMGISFIGLGMFIRKNKDRFTMIKPKNLILCFFIGIVLAVLSRWYVGVNETHFGSVIVAICMMTFGIQHSDCELPEWVKKWASCSTLIYLYHTIFDNITRHLCGIFRYDYDFLLTKNVLPIAICAVTTLFALFVNEMLSRKNKTTS